MHPLCSFITLISLLLCFAIHIHLVPDLVPDNVCIVTQLFDWNEVFHTIKESLSEFRMY